MSNAFQGHILRPWSCKCLCRCLTLHECVALRKSTELLLLMFVLLMQIVALISVEVHMLVKLTVHRAAWNM